MTIAYFIPPMLLRRRESCRKGRNDVTNLKHDGIAPSFQGRSISIRQSCLQREWSLVPTWETLCCSRRWRTS